MYSKQLRKALSMVMVVAMIMSVCAVCFGTFGNAYTVGGQTAISGSYSFDFTDSPLYDSTVGRNLLTMTKVQNKASIVKEGVRVLNTEYYGDPGDYMIDLIDKDVNLGSTDGHIVIQAGTTYTINLVAGRYVDDTHAASTGSMFLTLALVDADGKVFLVPPAKGGVDVPYGTDTWMKFGSGTSTNDSNPLKATIDGDGSVTIGGVEHAFAGCKLVVLCDIQPDKSGTVSVKNATISAVANASETYTVNYRKDSDNSTDYPTTGGTSQAAVKTDLVWNYSGAGASYLHTDNIFRFCFAPQTAANKQVGTNYYPDPTHVYHVGEASEAGTGYEFFRVADPDLATTANPYGKIIIEEGKAYSFSVEVRANGWSGDGIGDNYIWVTYGLYNPVTNAVYPLPYDESTLTATGAASFIYATPDNAWPKKTITATVDCATIGPDLNPYAGCELVIMGGGTRKGANFTVKDLTVVEIDSPNLIPEVSNRTYDYIDADRNEFYETSEAGTLWNWNNGPKPYVMDDSTSGAYNALVYQYFVTNPAEHAHSILDADTNLYVPNYDFYGTEVSYVVISDPDFATADNEYGILSVGKNTLISINLEVANTNYSTPNSNTDAKINRIMSIGLRDPETGKVFLVPGSTYASFTNMNNETKAVSATIDSTLTGPEGKSYEGCDVVLVYGGQHAGGNSRVWNASVTLLAPPSVKEGGAASIRPEIKEGDLDKFGADFEYKGYQSAGIRFSYTVADEKIANATDLGFVVGIDALLDAEGADPYGEWYDAASAMKTSTLGKKYADLAAGDTYAVTITGLSREDKVDSLRSNYFYVAFYYTVNGVTTYVPLEIDGATDVAYDSVLWLYEDLDAAGDYDADVYGDLAWYYY